MNWWYLIIGCLGAIGITYFAIVFHDVGVDNDKIIKLENGLFYNETCSELKDSIKFFNHLDEGHWIKNYDTSKYVNRMQELNCK